MSTDRLGITILEANTCWELLRSSEVGRLATSIRNHPDIFPVNFIVDHGTVVFRTAEGTKLAAAVLGASVAFEVDGYDAEAGEAWSVVIKGRAVEIERMQDVFDALDLPLFPWHAAPKHRFVRIVPDDVSGRRFHVVDASRLGRAPERHERARSEAMSGSSPGRPAVPTGPRPAASFCWRRSGWAASSAATTNRRWWSSTTPSAVTTSSPAIDTESRAVTVGTEVTFEVDALDERTRSGWSVIVRGVRYVTSRRPIASDSSVGDTWAPGLKASVDR